MITSVGQLVERQFAQDRALQQTAAERLSECCKATIQGVARKTCHGCGAVVGANEVTLIPGRTKRLGATP